MVKIRTLCHRYRMYRFLCFILLVSTCDVQGASFSEPGFTASARALDGDTIAADLRLLGVDAFERRQLCERRSEEHTSELQSLMRISYAVFCLKKKIAEQ